MPPLKPSSAKAKGRRHQQRIVRDILAAFPDLTPDDVRSTSMGAGGEDVLLSPAAQRRVPLSIEAKNCERLNVWAAIAQCEANAPPGRPPCVVFTRNHASAYAAVPWEWVLARLAGGEGRGGEGGGGGGGGGGGALASRASDGDEPADAGPASARRAAHEPEAAPFAAQDDGERETESGVPMTGSGSTVDACLVAAIASLRRAQNAREAEKK